MCGPARKPLLPPAEVSYVVGGVSADGRVVESAEPALLLLSHRPADAVELTRGAATETARVLSWWRARIAGWARSPSGPIPPDVLHRTTAMLADLDTPAVVQLLAEIEADQSMPDGARFETFAYLDRVLAVDLARDVGH